MNRNRRLGDRSCQVNIRISETERASMERLAKQLGITLTQLLLSGVQAVGQAAGQAEATKQTEVVEQKEEELPAK